MHRGEKATLDPPSNTAVNLSSSQLTNKKSVSNNINKTNKKIKKIKTSEVNLLHAVLTLDLLSQNELRDDARVKNNCHELKIAKMVDSRVRIEPTSVTLLNILGGKKNRKIMYEGLRVLLDTGCSDSLVRTTYARTGIIKKTKSIYSTGGGNITTHSQSTIFLHYQNLVIRK